MLKHIIVNYLAVTLILQVIACCKVTDAATVVKQNSIQHQTTASGEKYALPNKPSAKQLGVSICIAKLINQFIITCTAISK